MATAVDNKPGRVLVILLIAYIFNFLDRQIVSILAEPIKADLGLSDTQLGLMGGLAFALFYTGLGIPIALLADRKSRVTIISISLGVWSAFTAICGLAQNFWQLFLARMGVGVGEAGGVAPSYALIADTFPPAQRARALAIFSFGVPIGSALGVFFGGIIAAHVDWRAAFVIVGIAGVLLVPLVKFGIKEPPRGGLDRLAGAAPGSGPVAPAFRTVARTFASKPSFWLLAFGSACSSILGYGIAFWLPSFLSRSYGLELVDRSIVYGSVALIGGVAGVWLGGWLGDRAGARDVRGYARVPAICFLIAAPAYAIALFAPNIWVGFFLFLVPTALSLSWLGPVNAAIQHIVPPEMRATTAASFLFINNLLGIGFGTWFLGFMSDRMQASYGEESLRYSILYTLVFYLIAAVLYLIAARRLEKDWHRA
ncbi:spinster family MFS transporter [Allosphingosinicella indica]|uniref:Sugar phosphate permease n=1 Tax=Allosphingosinicella indica TaxID=941907 RepID=A0A1X7FZS5_9SPHN|nr:MFS transporter [Allosphingosinicella indica]SMF61602.1 Sugar phosphate permease [Allosphingosinicella indica]